MISFPVFLTADAARDLLDIYAYIQSCDVPGKADTVLDNLEQAVNSLSELPQRGTYPKELLPLGIREYREIYVHAYRIVYRVVDSTVYILLIADGRRDMQDLLQRRLLSS
ncbi:MAG: type II toxin-antitoxin system RelE/ParE family toxin [Desulfovermiculus sp.]|nr:type II toxin-antitoxin system RelE/ParE family toxin [Desulfovermiculus sp.]